jgi:2-methylcitrate dehydratase PrpD
MVNLAQELANFAVRTRFADLPPKVVRDTKMLLLDSIGCALAGVTSDPGKMAVFQFGLPYVLAVNAYKIRVGVEWQDMDTLRSPEIQGFARKVEVIVHPETAVKPQLTTLEITAKGKVFKGEKTLPKGVAEGGEAMSDRDLETKYRHNAQRVLTLDQIENSTNSLLNLEKVDKVSRLMAELS